MKSWKAGLWCCVMICFIAAGLAAVEQGEEKTAAESVPEGPAGPPPEIKDIGDIVGTWLYRGQWRMDPTTEKWVDHEARVTFGYVCGGAAIEMIYQGDLMGMEMHGLSLITYHREKEEWVETWVDNFTGIMSIYTGQHKDGKRVMTGKDIYYGETMYTRVTSYDITDDSFKWVMENSTDGENWYVSMKGDYTRQ